MSQSKGKAKPPKPPEQVLRSGSGATIFEITASSTSICHPTFDTILQLHQEPTQVPFPRDLEEDFTPTDKAINFPQAPGPGMQTNSSNWSPDMPKRTYNFRLTKWGSVTFAESYNEVVNIWCEGYLKDLSVLKFDSLDGELEQTENITAEFIFTDAEQYFKLNIKWEETAQSRKLVPPGRRDRFLHEKTSLGKLRVNPDCTDPEDWDNKYTYAANFCRYVRLVVRGFAAIKSERIFKKDIFAKILEDARLDQIDYKVQEFCQLQSKAIQAESDINAQQLASLKRAPGALQARIVSLPGFQDRFALRIVPTSKHDAFRVPEMSRAFIKAESGFFKDNLPGRVPNQPPKDEAKWQGQVFLKDRQIHCSIENLLSPQQTSLFRYQASLPDNKAIQHSDFEVSFDEDADQSIVGRLMRAIKALNSVMTHAINPDARAEDLPGDSDPRAPPQLDYQQYLPGLFLHKRPDKSVTRPITTNQPNLSSTFQSARFQLSETSHQAAITTVLQGEKGRTILEGPPATGKTTAMAKLIAILTHGKVCQLDGVVIATAHTNEAVRVLCARTLNILEQACQISNPEEFVCLVVSDSMLHFWKMSNKKFDPRIEKAMIGAHLEREAMKKPQQNREYLEQRRQVKMYGRSYQERKEYEMANKQGRTLLGQIKKRVQIWFATLSTLHMQHNIFGFGPSKETAPSEDGATALETDFQRLKCHVLIIDEASQATDSYVAMAILTTDPRNVVFAGDAKQLAPYHQSNDGRIAWSQSAFEKLKGRSQSQMLMQQFRSQPNMYAGTTAHYNNQVWSNPKIVDRQHGKNILQAVQKISFSDSTTNDRFLTSNIHIIDLQHTKCERHVTGTMTNETEWFEMRKFLLALRITGVRTDNIMVLTPYQGQYDLMRTNQAALHNMAIRKIDSSQGDEAECVVFGIVRTNATGLGFLGNLRRQNVATSRAREAAFYFIDMDMISRSNNAQAWHTWINGLRTQNKDLIIRMEAPVTWKVNGHEISYDVPMVMQLPEMPPVGKTEALRNPSPKPTSRSTSPVRPRSQSTGEGARPRSDSVGSSKSTAGSITGVSQRPQSGSSTPTRVQQIQMQVSSPRGQISTAHSRSGSNASTSGISGLVRSISGMSMSDATRVRSASRGSPINSPTAAGSLSRTTSNTPSTAPPQGHARSDSQTNNARVRLNQMETEIQQIRTKSQEQRQVVDDYLKSMPSKTDANSEYYRHCMDEHEKQTNLTPLPQSDRAVKEFGSTVASAISMSAYLNMQLRSKSLSRDNFKSQHGL